MDKLIPEIERVLIGLKEKEYILADTRLPFITLFDHLILTAGIAVAVTKELLLRGTRTEDICGENIPKKELLTVVRAASLLHDWGKDDEQFHVNHTHRSVEWSKGLLKDAAIEEPYFGLIISAVERHHLRDNPRTQLEKIICLADSLASAGDRSKLAKKKDEWTEFVEFRHATFELYHNVFGKEKGLALVLGDVDAVKSYVYETSKLPEIRGGSEILNELNNEETVDIFSTDLSKECLIYHGGGSFLAIVPVSLADDLIKKVERAYLTKTKVATITCVKSAPLGYYEFERGLKPYVDEEVKKLHGVGIGNWLLESHFGEDKDHWSDKKNFGELVSDLSAELRNKKARKEYIPFFEALPIVRRCQSCGMRAASREEVLCEICYTKRTRGRGEKLEFLDEFAEWLNENKVEMTDLFRKIPKDLEELTRSSKGYLAVIFADGNNIGSLLEKANSPAHYRHISEELHKGIKDAVFGALFDIIGERFKKFEKLPFEIINIGGDDISLIIAAPFAFQFSKRFLEYFENNMENKLGKELGEKITISLGMVICKHDYPVYFAEKIANSLLKDAKTIGKAECCSSLSYLYLTTSIAAEDGREIIKEVYQNEGEKIKLTMRPYTLPQYRTILQKAGDFKRLFPSSQRNAISKALSMGKAQSESFLFYQIGRMDEKNMKETLCILKDLTTQLAEQPSNFKHETHKIWLKSKDAEYATYLLDMFEIIKIAGDELDERTQS